MAANPALAQKGVYISAGLFDIAFPDVGAFQSSLDVVGIPYVVDIVPFGVHYWPMWQVALRRFGRKALWKPVPFTFETGRS